MTSPILTKLKSINPWHLVWLSVIISELFTALFNIIQSLLWFGEISPQLLIIGTIDGAFVPLIVAPIIIYLIKKTDELKNLNKQLHQEIAERRRIEQEKDRLYTERSTEKERLLMDLHDGVGGITTNIFLLSELAQKMEDVGSIKQTLTTISQCSQEGIAEIRNLMRSLDSNALSWQALAVALRSEGAAMVEPHGIKFMIETAVDDISMQPGSLLWVNLLRIYKEALTNAIKHARARSISVALNITGNGLALCVQDDGIGWDGNTKCGRGSSFMKKRAEEVRGAVTIAALEKGTQVSVRMPILQ
jgi:signal transduction histidine kinase